MLTNSLFNRFGFLLMRSAYLSFLVGIFATSAVADSFHITKTDTIDGFYIGVTGPYGAVTNASVDDYLNYGIWRTNSNNVATVYIPTAHEYIYLIDLVDTNNQALPKTELGKIVGAKFFDLGTSFVNNKSKGVNLKIEHTVYGSDIGLQSLFFPSRPGYGNSHLYRPSDLFEIKKPGDYRLRIRFQILVRPDQGNYGKVRLIRFQPLEFPLVAPVSRVGANN